VGILCVAHSGNGTEVELPQITCGGKLSNFEFSTYCPPRTGLALAYVPIRDVEIIISVDMDEYKNIYVISQKHTGLREV
ncbi:hypothetical protein Q2V38_25470, partial [Escherichia coli]